jgi:hypothetical protein
MDKAMRTLLLLAMLALLAAPTALASTSTGGTTATPPPGETAAPPPSTLPVDDVPDGTAFDGGGMWIWYLSQSSGGNLDTLAARARRAGVTTVFIKSSDGPSVWSQFTKTLVSKLHKRGLRACGWGYVYGRRPILEARAARAAILRGADCFVIDAEAEYEGRYTSAGKYMRRLRAYAGTDYPIGAAPFPYVDYHPAFPYSVFLGPGGAQFNLPQMYWRAIGTSVKNVFQRTYSYSTLYAKPIYPLGQTYGGVTRKGLVTFRRYTQLYQARGLSWWSWQATTTNGWNALSEPLDALPAGKSKVALTPTLRKGARGDVIVWAQQHLLAAGYAKQKLTGRFGRGTLRYVRAFQRRSALRVTGALDQPTWAALLQRPAAKVRWGTATSFRNGKASAASRPVPSSAKLPAKRYEIGPRK